MTERAIGGLFVTLEGGEGGGKSTVLAGLRRRALASGQDVVVTREPGGTAVGERLRAVLLDPEVADLSAEAEALLFCAARAESVRHVLRPALAAGRLVLGDRFTDSTLAYQGHGRGLSLSRLEALNQLATDGLRPDLTLLFDVPVDIGLARRRAAEDVNRLDHETRAFHERVRQGFLTLSTQEPERFVVLDATMPAAEVEEAAWCALRSRLRPAAEAS